jgi:hypothetical protein
LRAILACVSGSGTKLLADEELRTLAGEELGSPKLREKELRVSLTQLFPVIGVVVSRGIEEQSFILRLHF